MTTPMHTLSLYRDRNKKWRWRLVARNGKKVANGGEGYSRRKDCLEMALAILQGSLAFTVQETT